jgi:hypothetical protein
MSLPAKYYQFKVNSNRLFYNNIFFQAYHAIIAEPGHWTCRDKREDKYYDQSLGISVYLNGAN